MRFSDLISALELGSAGLQSHQLAENPELRSGASLEQAEKNEVSFLEKGSSLITELSTSKVGAVLLPPQEDLRDLAESKGIAWAVLQNPRLGFAETLDLLHPRKKKNSGIHPTAVIGNSVQIEEGASICANVSIGANSKIGKNSIIHPGVVIYENVLIGDETEIHANVVIHENSKIGNGCIINANAVLGSEGFGFVPTEQGWRKMPQTGQVILGENVEIGSASTVDRPCVGKTFIDSGTKIDNLVQVGHGVSIGKHCAIASQVGIAGGADIGNGVILAGQVGVANRAKIGDKVVASSKSGLHGSVAPDQVVSGFPAIPHKLWLRSAAAFSKLPEILKTLRELKGESSI